MRSVLLYPLFAACAFLVFFCAGCGKPQGRPPIKEVPVVGYKAQGAPLEDAISVVGTLEANEIVELKSEIAGRVEKLAIEEGSAVKKGEVLVELDRKALEAELARAEADLHLARNTQARYAALSETNAVSRQDVDQAVASLETRQAAVNIVKAQLDDAIIVVPFDGVVTERMVSAGQFISAGTRLTTLIDADPMKAEFNVPERYLAVVAAGQTIQLTVAAYPREIFSGEVYFVDPQVDPVTRTVLIKAYVANPQGLLRRGMFANLRLITRVRENAVLVPEASLMLQGKSASLYVVKPDGTVEPRAVQTGMRLAGRVEVVSGVSAGEIVVVEGGQKVFPGVKAVVRYETQNTD